MGVKECCTYYVRSQYPGAPTSIFGYTYCVLGCIDRRVPGYPGTPVQRSYRRPGRNQARYLAG
eukprot:1686325-Rhodomonas_salina.1